MNWTDITDGGRTYCMKHLHEFTQRYNIASQEVEITFNFGFHVFTDDKGNGRPIVFRKETRFFSRERYEASHQILDFIGKRLLTAKVRAYYDRSSNQNYFCLDDHDYALFIAISKPVGSTNKMRFWVISAYEVDSWGRSMLPKGDLYNLRYVLEMRNTGRKIGK